MRSIARCEIPSSEARRRLLQRSAPGGGSCNVFASTASTLESLIEQPLQALRQEALSPFADRLLGQTQPLCHLPIRASVAALQEDARAQRERAARAARVAGPVQQLLILLVAQQNRLQV